MQYHNLYNKVDDIVLIIAQPRSIGTNKIKEWIVPKPYWEIFRERFKLAFKEINENPTYRRGSWCKHCPALGDCPETRGDKAILPLFFSGSAMTVSDAAHILEHWDILEKAKKRADSLLLDTMLKGDTVPGFKLVTQVKHRQWRDEEKAKAKLVETFGPGCLKAPTPAAAEKLGKQAKPIVSELAYTPKGDPVVAREDDKRFSYENKTAEQIFGKITSCQ
jgi:hypothetical protein